MDDLREYAEAQPKANFPYIPMSLTPVHRKGDFHNAFHKVEEKYAPK